MNIRLLLVLLCLTTVTGCVAAKGGSHSLFSMLRFKADESPGDSKGDPWVQQAGNEIRGEHTREDVVDPLHLRNLFMSEQSRAIERNLGVGD